MREKKRRNGFFMIFSFLFLSHCDGVIIDMTTGGQFASNWLEVGVANITDRYWTTVTSQYSSFVTPAIFTALPEHGGLTYSSGVPTATRLRNILTVGGRVTWQMKVREILNFLFLI